MEIGKETVRGLRHGHTVVGSSRVKLTELDVLLNKGVLLRCPGTTDPSPNSAPVWVGSEMVTADSNVGTGGMPVNIGSSLFVPCERANSLWVISTDPLQDIAWMAT